MDYYVLQTPSQIDGEPHEVADHIEQDLRAMGAILGRYVAEAFVQLRAAGLDSFDSVEEWEASPEGERATELRMRATALVATIRRFSS